MWLHQPICDKRERIISFSASLQTMTTLSLEIFETMLSASSKLRLRCFIWIAGPQFEYISKPLSAAFVTPTVKDCIWADNQKITDIEEEKTRIEFTSTQWLKVKEWILAQGENAIPRSPQWFVDSWKNTVLEMNENLKPFYSVKKGTR